MSARGIAIASKVLLERNPVPPKPKCGTGSPRTCAVTPGYDKIVRAVLDPAAEMRGGSPRGPPVRRVTLITLGRDWNGE